jgi:hypothetical protein
MKIIALTMSLLIVLVFLPAVSAQSIAAPSTFVSLQGLVISYSVGPSTGATKGWCVVSATIGKSAHALMTWPSGKPTISIMYNFYIAVLLGTTLVALNYKGAELYIQGYWDVHYVTYINQPGGGNSVKDILLVHNGPGTFSVTNNWQTFTTLILGVPPLVVIIRGIVISHVIRSMDTSTGEASGQKRAYAMII